MAHITYKQADGTATTVDVPVGCSVMRGAVDNGVDGILAECGGGAICATCHVYIDEASTAKLPPIDDLEDELLQVTASPRLPGSRLACQLPAMEGLVILVPEKQL
ncbi:2Fe-2S iron-sulfur cluster-binding protein [Allorhizocola rhizosphaerae]|uniref:2Fe-2S iron-sulfur cluster-binding protein n=1 Tax=Allorhizocola rhizosphaerae TaxID=1872709 RepID=UPI000E3BD16E|nr:2Fe-2S iron-sulfur cluster-binding protein [Allorhizocola rhizosphaerae]